jgi:glycosyltransferase involved in cell wall biosynthesis
VVLGVGRFTRAKDFGTLIKAFRLVRNTIAARLVILGEGDERWALESMVEQEGLTGQVALPGFVPNPYAYMRAASVFVLSSEREGLPTVLVEAMATGTPVVAPDCPSGPREILDDGAFGRLVPVGDATAIAEAVCDVLKRQPETSSAQLRAQEFSVDAAVGAYVDLFRELLGSRS